MNLLQKSFVSALFVGLTAVVACSSDSAAPACTCTVTDNGASQSLACGESVCLNLSTYSCSATAAVTSVSGCTTVADAGTKDSAPTVDSGPAKDAGADSCVHPTDGKLLFGVAEGGRAFSLTTSGADLYYLWTTVGVVKITLRKLVAGLGAPVDVQALNGNGNMHVIGDSTSVYYTDKRAAAVTNAIDGAFRKVGDGAPVELTNQVLSQVNDAAVGRSLALNGSLLYVPFDSGANSANAAGIRIVPVAGGATSLMPGTGSNGFTTSIVAADPGGYVAAYQNSIAGNPGGNKVIRVLDPANNYAVVGTTPTAVELVEYTRFGVLGVSGNTLVWVENTASKNTLKACTLPGCKPVEVNADFSGFVFTMVGGRVYFQMRIVNDGCGSPTVALASCAVADAATGTCVPKVHGKDVSLLGASSIAILGTNAFVTGQDGNTYRMPL